MVGVLKFKWTSANKGGVEILNLKPVAEAPVEGGLDFFEVAQG